MTFDPGNWANSLAGTYIMYRLWEDSKRRRSGADASPYKPGGISRGSADPAPDITGGTIFNIAITVWCILGMVFAVVAAANIESEILGQFAAAAIVLSPVIFIFIWCRGGLANTAVWIPDAAVIDKERLERLPHKYNLKIDYCKADNGSIMLFAKDREGSPLFFVPTEICKLVGRHYKDRKFKCRLLKPRDDFAFGRPAIKIYYNGRGD